MVENKSNLRENVEKTYSKKILSYDGEISKNSFHRRIIIRFFELAPLQTTISGSATPANGVVDVRPAALAEDAPDAAARVEEGLGRRGVARGRLEVRRGAVPALVHRSVGVHEVRVRADRPGMALVLRALAPPRGERLGRRVADQRRRAVEQVLVHVVLVEPEAPQRRDVEGRAP